MVKQFGDFSCCTLDFLSGFLRQKESENVLNKLHLSTTANFVLCLSGPNGTIFCCQRPFPCWHLSGIILIVTRKVSLELSSLQAAQAAVWPSVIFAHTVLLLEIAVQDEVLRTQNTAH